MSINGEECDRMNHQEIVSLIRSTRDRGVDPELILTIRPNCCQKPVQSPEEEPDFRYVPANCSPTTKLIALKNGQLDPLHQSMLLMHEAVEAGSALIQFEQLARKKGGETFDAARHPDNSYKNRYRDILPYDSTRVVLTDSFTGDYVNASFVAMSVPASGVVNRYIATQVFDDA